ncbi:2-hydroxymuconate tautomerase [Apilactobacillus xinyiensis]|uniref:2-hydroxymuconate tautomerase n=1 Tax=Apilactobacillus xinyiensis TaxID=2841032 RepID=UPI002557325C|nr:2-hydroxymuconate tautomerase [Apilactobacillus xinyiensis]
MNLLLRSYVMPIINVNLIEGRSEEQLKNLVKDITTVVSKDTGAPEEHIHVILNEMRKDRYSVGGKLKSEEN